jgi:hydrogenase-4 component F
MYALLRFDAITSRAIGSGFSHTLLLIFGGVSLAVASLLMIVQRDLKRLLAYSSIEHMGIVAIGIGLGGALGLFGALLHTFNHSIAKTFLFFTAGNVRENFGTLRMERIRGMARSLPWTGSALILGALAITGMPPFGLFVSELLILTAAFSTAHYFIAVLMLAAISMVFGALLHHFQYMLMGKAEDVPVQQPAFQTSWFVVMGVCVLCLLVLGIHVPAAFAAVLRGAMAVLQPAVLQP